MNYADRVRDTSTSTGTGDIALAGAPSAGEQAFSAALPVGSRVPYMITGGAEWESGIGTLTAATTLSRDEVFASSNGGAKVNFSAGTKSVFLTLPAALIPAGHSKLDRLVHREPVSQQVQVEITAPAAGTSATLATFTGAGTVTMLQLTVSAGTLHQDGRVQVFVDGEAAPSIDVDLATCMLTGLDACTAPYTGSTENVLFTAVGAGTDYGVESAVAVGIRFPIPFSNGCVIKLFTPPGVTITGSGTTGKFFSQISCIAGRTTHTARWRLRSRCVPYRDAPVSGGQSQIDMLDLSPCKGTLAYLGYACKPISSTSLLYLERMWWVAVENEDVTPNAAGAIKPSFATSGGEDLFLAGWYFANQNKVTLPAGVLVTSGKNASGTTTAGVDFLQLYEHGIPFNTRLRVGWSLKEGPYGVAQLANFPSIQLGYTLLYYEDITASFAPTAPSAPRAAKVVAGDTNATVSWLHPDSRGTAPITDYVVQYRATGSGSWLTWSDGTSAIPAPTTITGLTNGTGYDFRVAAVNSVGTGTYTATLTATPAAAGGGGGGGGVTPGTTITDDSFAGADRNITAAQTPQSQTYTLVSGNAPRVVSNKVRRAVSQSAGSDTAVIAAGQQNVSVVLDFTASSSPTRNFGAVSSQKTTNPSIGLAGAIAGDTARLYVNSVERGNTAIANVGNGASHTLELRRSGTTVNVLYDGATVISYTLTGSEVTALGTNSVAGLTIYSPVDDGLTQISRLRVIGI